MPKGHRIKKLYSEYDLLRWLDLYRDKCYYCSIHKEGNWWWIVYVAGLGDSEY